MHNEAFLGQLEAPELSKQQKYANLRDVEWLSFMLFMSLSYVFLGNTTFNINVGINIKVVTGGKNLNR